MACVVFSFNNKGISNAIISIMFEIHKYTLHKLNSKIKL